MVFKVSEHFTLREFLRSGSADRADINNAPESKEAILNIFGNIQLLATEVLEPVRELLGAPLLITSGYRSGALNRLVGGSEQSQHMLGEAVDFVPKGLDVLEAAQKISDSSINFDQMVYECRKRQDNLVRWIHISYRRANNRNEILHTYGGTQYHEGLPGVTSR